ncbi:FecR domain-containing protein [Chitinophaga filiformis]|uniref:Ferric-dicitrate binding protein FerR, regulates iron transport through sigma-19 n=1 Tax=Chitinophaga filiformis TaxID=104663 RepID=A0A1G7WZ51_CHIFI|nr:FecR domain-containing protein [Chitinophaga filiformis]SDG77194.1 ferric-dicitrate binding protein FerR, regulates iron transport through sigma-19 [Chitinophaga filiformis]
MIDEELFTTLAARKLAGEATTAEQQELEMMLQEYPELRERYQLLQQYFTVSAYHSSAETEQALQRTMSRINISATPVKRMFPWKWIGVAAAAVLITAVAVVVLRPRQQQAEVARLMERQNGKATKATIELADGSKIWLNADSKLSYPEVFNGNSREVYLNGEAFFDIAANPKKPFIVHLSSGTVHVLGTSFNIRAYENEAVQTSVKTGKVAFIPVVAAGQQPDTIYITPDEKVTYRKAFAENKEDAIVRETTSAEDDKAWTEGRLVFRDKTLEEIAAELERTFGKKVSFGSDAPRYYRLTGSFQDNSLQDIMYYLARSKAFHYSITDSTLLITE